VTPRRVGLVADDLTGATDSAVQFAAVGWSAHLLRNPTAGPDLAGPGPSLLAVATEVRAVGNDDAAERTAAAVRELLALGCDRLYLKIDSTMRGSVVGQLRGALAAWSVSHPDAVVVLCPAFPDQNRTVVDGQLLVDGVPVAHTAAAADPVTPVLDSWLERLVPGAVAVTPSDLDAAVRPGSDPARLMFADASTDADLDAIAAAVDRLGPCGVVSGSAGLAAAMARRWSAGTTGPASPVRSSTRILVAVSSLHPVTAMSVARLRGVLTAPGAQGQPAVDVITTPESRAATSAEIAADFGERVAEQLRRRQYDALVLVGGDGAAATLDRVGATSITVHAALAPGIPIGTISGGAANGLRVVTKSGGFGDADSLIEIVDLLQTSAPREETHDVSDSQPSGAGRDPR
jgi:D-threonate/D-erythronate kinase